MNISLRAFLEEIKALVWPGAEGIISGCTILTLLIRAGNLAVTLSGTTLLHAETTVKVVT